MTISPMFTPGAPGFGPRVTDETLVKAVLAGDGDAYGELYRRHVSTVMGYVVRRTLPSDAHEDLVQEAFTQALERIGEFREDAPEYESFGQWLCGIAGCVVFKYTKSRWAARQAERESAQALKRELREGPAQTAGSVALPAGLAAKVAALRPHYRRVVELFYLDGMSQEQTAEVMGVSVVQVNNYLAAARAELRNPGKRKHYAPETRAKLIEAARQLIAERGVKGAKGCLIAERAGVGQALINRYFGGCAGLLAKVTGRPAEAKRGPALRAHVVDVARQVVAEVGIDRASAAQIAHRAGVARATVYAHFGSRAALLALATGEQGQVAA